MTDQIQFSLRGKKLQTNIHPTCLRPNTPITCFIETNKHHHHNFTHNHPRYHPGKYINSPLIYNNNTLNTTCYCALCRQNNIYFNNHRILGNTSTTTTKPEGTLTTYAPVTEDSINNVIPYLEFIRHRKHHRRHRKIPPHYRYEHEDTIYTSQLFRTNIPTS